MKYLIIGGTGLISTSITKRLLELGKDVTVLNRGLREQRFPQGVKTITADRKNPAEFAQSISNAETFDFVIDMICYQPSEAEDAVQVFKGKIDQYIFCSTVDVYTKPANWLPYTESEPRKGITTYAKNKIRCEDIFMEAHNRGDFKVTTIRPAATYGEGGTIIHSLGWSTTYLDRLMKGKPVIVHGDGTSLWVMCHIDDVAKAHVAACGNPKVYGQAYHTTGEEWLTWNKYHEIITRVLDAPAPNLVHIPTDILAKIDPNRFGIVVDNFCYNNIFDNSKAKNDLGFQYTIPFKEGARRTISWLQENQKIENSDEDPFEDKVLEVWQNLEKNIA